MNLVITTYKSTEDVINKLQPLKGTTKSKFYKNISNYYDIMNIKFDEDPFAKNAQGISKIYQKVLLLMKLLQTKPQVKNMNINYYDLFYTIIKNRNEKGSVDIKLEKDDNDYFDIKDFITPNRHIGRKNDKDLLR